MKYVTKTINGNQIKMTEAQAHEFERDGMVIVGEQIVRSSAYIKRVHDGARKSIRKTTRVVLG